MTLNLADISVEKLLEVSSAKLAAVKIKIAITIANDLLKFLK